MKQILKQARHLFLLLPLVIASMLTENVAAQTCATPLTLTVNDCNSYSVTDSVTWLSFNSGSPASWCNITASVPSGDPATITGIELYSGSCASLTLVETGGPDIGEFVVKGNINPSTNYLLKVVRSNSIAGQLNVCTDITSAGLPCSPCTTGCQLICNSDLESYQGAANNQNVSNLVLTNTCSWGTPGGGTPDYFNDTFFNPRVQDTNFVGWETPHSGAGYAGIYTFFSFSGNQREYIQQQLQAPLVAGKWYTLTFWVSLSDYSGHAISHLGAYISASQPIQTSWAGTINATPQIFAPNVITTTNGWVPITGTFQAAGGEQWITIGSFEIDLVQQHPLMVPFPTATNPFFPNPPSNPNYGAYYYIDDVTLQIAEPCFSWYSSCGIVNFFHSTPCDSLVVSELWNFDDPASGTHDTSTLSNPTHVFSQSGVPYYVVHTIYTAYDSLMCIDTVVQTPIPVANITGYQTNNCGSGFLTYTANPCSVGIVYTWIVTGGTPSTTSGCSTNITWNNTGGQVILAAWDSTTDCTGYDTLIIPVCCDYPGLRIDNQSASYVLSNPTYAPYVTGNVFNGTSLAAGHLIITGVFTVDVPITFINCQNIDMGANTPVLVNPGQTLTFNKCTTQVKCDTMWYGIELANVTSTVNIINGSVIQQAKYAVISNSGGKYTIQNSTLQNNYKDIVVNAYSGTHPGTVRNTNFTMNAPFLTAFPALPVGHTKTVCAIEITDNANITIGDPTTAAMANNFTNIFVGVRSNNSITKVVNCRFANIITGLPQVPAIPDAGTAVVAIGKKNALYQPSITVGGVGLNRCVMINTRIGVDARDITHVNVKNNNITDTRLYGVRVQRCNTRNITVEDNNINNNAVTYGFNTGVLVLECYDAVININRNVILQTGNTASNYAQQSGTGIRVACVSPADITLNIQSNNSISRVRTGIWVQNLVGKNKVFIGGNSVNFTKPNAAYTTAHYGIRLEGCATVRCDTNTVTKSAATGLPTAGMVKLLRGISIENSPVTVATDNIFTRLGSGLYGWETSSSSTLACNIMNRCYNGVFFAGSGATGNACDIGDQINDPTNTASATGNTWVANVSLPDQINGKVSPNIVWRYQTTPPTAVNATGIAMQQVNYNACNVFFLAPQQLQRDQQVGAALRSAADTNTSAENRYQLRRYAHRKLTQTPTWLNLGFPDDTLYQNFYNNYDQTNIGTLRQIELAADTGGFQFVGSASVGLSCSNIPEQNAKTVYGIYAATWMQGIAEFTSTDSAILLSVALQDPAEGGTAVYSARVMLDLEIDYYGSSSQRLGQDNPGPVSQSELMIYPNPANESVNLEIAVEEGQDAQAEIYDLNGRLVLSQQLAPQQEAYTINTAILPGGVYIIHVVVDGEATESQRLVIVK